MSCECCSYSEEVFHQRFLPYYPIWIEANDDYNYKYDHPIIKREIEMGISYVKKLLPEQLHSYISYELSTIPFYSKQEQDGSYKEENRQIRIEFLLRLA